MKRSLLLVLVVLMGLSLLAGCNTMRGMGEDIEQGGEAIQRQSSSY
ncbi:entericidin A/B family lipoprotein [Halomonas sp. MCCC 1A11036]|uniref:Entericidin A/B family lipoprotein n=1 Tax=Billgrantia zhangzhouensis TaxID=2733481 RepID=A0ABS9AKP6_9GAMM|nr:entericidin A/B family lipoprotein [Halomonas zhangzhouensis]MCE8022363.1 entericidin A/B family lipoprotein [Halomonas zhangzhouensis]